MAKGAGGRPKFELTEEMIQNVETFAAQGLTQVQIAHCLGISYQTLNERKKENAEIVEAIKRGQAKGIGVITNALFTAAKGGNITAQIFYLKNRAPEDWMDRKAIEMSGYVSDRKAEDLTDDELAHIAAGGIERTDPPKGDKAKSTRVH